MKSSLDLEVTRRCNLRCDYCFVGWSRDWTSVMPVPIALQIIREGAGQFQILHLTGGEPFAYRALFELIEAGLELGYEEIMINTNGTLLNDGIGQRLAGYGSRMHISVSLDGPEPIHDPVRGAGMFKLAAQGIDLLLGAGVRVTVMSVVTPAVLAELAHFIPDLFRAHAGIVGVMLWPVGVGPEGTQKPGVKLYPLTPVQLRELALAVALFYRMGFNIGVSAYPVINPLLSAFGYPKSRLYQCTAGRGRICVHADLTVSTCHPVKDPVYGHWQSGLFQRLHEFPGHQRMATRDFDGCRSCRLQEECGHCRAFVTGAGMPLYGNDRICREALPPVVGSLDVIPLAQIGLKSAA